MRYRQRPGIVCVNICGRPMLVPTRAVSQACKQVMPLSKLWLMAWDMIGINKTEEEITKLINVFRQKSFEETRAEVDSFFERLYQNGFLIAVLDDETDDPTEEG